MFNDDLQIKVDALGFKTYTPIQTRVFEIFDKESHIVGLAPTGTGKTLAYLLPILNALNPKINAVQAVICVPTNDLVYQVADMLKPVNTGFTVKAYAAGKDRLKELASLDKEQPQIVITTPGRLEDYAIKSNKLKVHTASYLVLDEADMMLDMDFLTTLDPVFNATKDAKMLLFSATLPLGLNKWLTTYFGSYKLIDLKDPSSLNITHGWILTLEHNRLETLLKVLKTFQPYLCMVFVSKKEHLQMVYDAMQAKGYKVVMLSGDTNARERKGILEDIKALKYTYVVSSDLGARGIDIDGVSHVVQYELPYQLEFYIHRAGRTGRKNQSGTVYTLYTKEQSRKLDALKKKGIALIKFGLDKDALVQIERKIKSNLTKEELLEIRKIKKPTKVSPNYKKKNKKEVKKARNRVRYGG